MSNRRNYYRILHVQPEAPLLVIRSSYRTIMQKLKYHPDLGGDHTEATIINEAYAVLNHPEKRLAYDKELRQAHAQSKLGGEQYHKRDDINTKQDSNHQTETVSNNSSPNNPGKQCRFCNTPHSQRSYHQPEATCTQCDSPLSQVSPLELQQSCRRAVTRMTKNEKIHIYTDWPQKHKAVTLQDISPNGMSFTANEPVANSKIIKIVSHLVHAIAEVKSCQSNLEYGSKVYSIGVRFLTIKFQKNKGTFIIEQA